MNHWIKNIKALEARDRELAARVRSTSDDPRVRLVKSAGKAVAIEVMSGAGDPVVFKRQGMPGNVRKIAEKKQFGFSEVIILLGAGLCEILEETLTSSDAGTFILLIESNPAYFKKLLEGFDVAALIGDPRVTISLGEDPVEAVMNRLEEAFGVFTRPHFKVIKHGLAVSCDTAYYQEVDKVLLRQKTMAEGNLLSIGHLSAVWQRNIFSNLNAIVHSPGIKHLFNRFAGVPAIIVAAGPSLDKNCRWLKTVADSAVIISVDTALKTLLKNGITPHFVVALDALLHNYFHMADAERPDYTLIVNPVTYPLILKECSGPMMITSYSEPMVQWMEQFVGDLGENITGGSVATSAFDLAYRMGCSPIILTGQDLAFTGGRTHSGGGANEELLYSSGAEMVQPGLLHEEAIGNELQGTVQGNLGHALTSSVKMTTWRNWFEIRIAQKKIDCINATEGGARIAGARSLCLQEALMKQARRPLEVSRRMAEARPVHLAASEGKIAKRLENLLMKARDIKKICSLGIKEAELLAGLAQKKGGEGHLAASTQACGNYLNMVMRESEFLQINHWRLETAMDKIQRLRTGIRTSEEGKQAYVNAESFLIFFKEAYQVTREFEKNVKTYQAGAAIADGGHKANAV